MKDLLPRRLRLALPFTILSEDNCVRLVAGEDFRYTLAGPGLERWLPDLLGRLNGNATLEQAIQAVALRERQAALQVIEQLLGERVLTDAPTSAAHQAAEYHLLVEGSGELPGRLAQRLGSTLTVGLPLRVFCQDQLDYAAALRFNQRCRADGLTWFWATYGPLTRAYLSPLFLPDAGPCLGCLLSHFRRLSPAPEFYDALTTHVDQGNSVMPVTFPTSALDVLVELVLWKATLLRAVDPPAALYRLHVLEVETLEITAHRVFIDPYCSECGEAVSWNPGT